MDAGTAKDHCSQIEVAGESHKRRSGRSSAERSSRVFRWAYNGGCLPLWQAGGSLKGDQGEVMNAVCSQFRLDTREEPVEILRRSAPSQARRAISCRAIPS
jgi:hypothetical protein